MVEEAGSPTEDRGMNQQEFFSALFGQCESGHIEFRFLPSKERRFVSFEDIKSLSGFPDDENVLFGVATRDGEGGTKANLLEVPALWADLDLKDSSKEDLRERFKGFPLKCSMVVNSGGGYHCYWILKTPVRREEIQRVENINKRLAAYLGGDRAATDAARILRVPGTRNQKYTPPRPVNIVKLDASLHYYLESFEETLPELSVAGSEQTKDPEWYKELLSGVGEGRRNESACKLAGRFLGKGLSSEEALSFLLEWNRRNRPPLPEEEIRRVVESISRSHEQDQTEKSLPRGKIETEAPWPTPLAEEAYHGLAGDLVRLVDPHTEADRIAVLIQFLAAFGNVIGRGAYFPVEADRHFPNIFAVLVGETSKGRKGTAWGHVRARFHEIEEAWVDRRILGGLSSGEGLMWQVRDQVLKNEPIKERGRITGYQEVIADPGESDKRVLIVQPEFAAVLRVIEREGNTLSPIVRQAWDDGNLRALTKNTPTTATGAHISLLGHITKDELRRYLDKTEAGNGFGNRFIWLCVKRSKILPEGGRLEEVEFGSFTQRVREAVTFAKHVGRIEKNEEAKEIWAGIYEGLSEGKPGLLGALTSRAEAQAMRLALIYSLLDCSRVIRAEHLLAALAIWDYAEASGKYIFGDAVGDPAADQILSALRASPAGLTRTSIHGLFGRHKKGEQIQTALSLLARLGKVELNVEKTEGRSTERWRALSCEKSESG